MRRGDSRHGLVRHSTSWITASPFAEVWDYDARSTQRRAVYELAGNQRPMSCMRHRRPHSVSHGIRSAPRNAWRVRGPCLPEVRNRRDTPASVAGRADCLLPARLWAVRRFDERTSTSGVAMRTFDTRSSYACPRAIVHASQALARTTCRRWLRARRPGCTLRRTRVGSHRHRAIRACVLHGEEARSRRAHRHAR